MKRSTSVSTGFIIGPDFAVGGKQGGILFGDHGALYKGAVILHQVLSHQFRGRAPRSMRSSMPMLSQNMSDMKPVMSAMRINAIAPMRVAFEYAQSLSTHL